jgi:polyferredoxin
MNEFNLFHAFELPMMLSMLVMAIVIVVSSLFVYRPWCNLFCPFGLAAWVVERVSLFRVRIDRHKCTDCGLCVTESPCTAMEHILNKKGLPGDCFLCGQCVEVCPTDAIILAIKDKKK